MSGRTTGTEPASGCARIAAAPTLAVGATTLRLLPERAAWCAESGTLYVADLHLGKTATYRRLGVPVPDGADEEVLDRLETLVRSSGARTLVVLGDFVHERRGPDDSTRATFARRRAAGLAGVAIDVVLGNHDPRPDDGEDRDRSPFPTAWGVRALRAGAVRDGIRLTHDPEEPIVGLGGEVVADDEPRLAGHLHPTVHVGGGAVVPAFHWRGAASPPTLVLPAFSRFTRGARVRARRADRVFAIADEAVVELR